MSNTGDRVAADPSLVLDLALERYLEEDAPRALRICGGLVERVPRHAAAWFVVGLCSAALGDSDAAAAALHASFHLARGTGQLALAAAAAHELRAYGDDTRDRLVRLAEDYLTGAAPSETPPFLPLSPPVVPWSEAMTPSEVTRRIGELAKLELPEWGGSPKLRAAPKAPWAGLDPEGLAALLLRFKVAFAKAGTTLIQEGSSGSEIFIMAWGSAVVHRDSTDATTPPIALLDGGDIFGEMAALTRTTRTANVTARRISVVLVAKSAALDEVVEQHPPVGAGLVAHCRQRMLQNLFAASPVLKVVEPSARAQLLACFDTVAFEPGEVLMQPGESPDGLHVIALGKLRATEDPVSQDSATRELGVGDVVGETAIVLQRPATALVVALAPTVTLRLPRDRFLRLVEDHPLVLRELYTLATKRLERSAEQTTYSVPDLVLL